MYKAGKNIWWAMHKYVSKRRESSAVGPSVNYGRIDGLERKPHTCLRCVSIGRRGQLRATTCKPIRMTLVVTASMSASRINTNHIGSSFCF